MNAQPFSGVRKHRGARIAGFGPELHGSIGGRRRTTLNTIAFSDAHRAVGVFVPSRLDAEVEAKRRPAV